MSAIDRIAGFSLTFSLCLASAGLCADPLTKRLEIDFGRDVASRHLAGLATRSDGGIVPGPVLTDLTGPAVGELLWALEPVSGPDFGRHWLVGTGPEGRINEVTLTDTSYTCREFAHLAEPQVLAVKSLSDGSALAGTSPIGVLYLLKDGKPAARVALPVDSIFDIILLPKEAGKSQTPRGSPVAAPNPEPGSLTPELDGAIALVATGNPGRIYRVDLAKFARAGVNPYRITDSRILAQKGVTLWGEIRDRNVRRIVVLANGKIAAGSAPKGNVYLFPPAVGPTTGSASPVSPVILQENHDAEVTDLLPQPNGDLFASIVFSAEPRESRINRPRPVAAVMPAAGAPVSPSPVPGGEAALPAESGQIAPSEPPKTERFPGRSTLVYFPADGFPENLLLRSNLAFYRLARRGDLLMVAAGEEGEVLAWDLRNRLTLTFAGSVASQLSGFAPLPGSDLRFLLLKNNAPGLVLLDFAASGPRRLETNRLDLGIPAEFGDLRFDKLSNIALDAIDVETSTSLGADETEGWTGWTHLSVGDGALRGGGLRGRYFKLKIIVPATARDFEIDSATLFHLPQNRRPVLTEFRVLPPNLTINPAPEASPSPFTTLGQVLNPNQPLPGGEIPADTRRRLGILGSQLMPSLGSQVVYWTASDPDGDTLAYTFSIKRLGASDWTDIAVNIRDNYVKFDMASLADGIYLTRLIVAEQAPRPAAQRLQAEFATDDFLVDHTPPEILLAAVRRAGADVIVTIHGRDALSLLTGAEFVFNNGYRESIEHPVDGISDGREESYEVQIPGAKVLNATSVEIYLYDQPGNSSVRRLTLP